MVHLVLDDLGGEALIGPDPHLEGFVLVLDFDLPEAFALPGTAQEGEATFLCLIGLRGLQDHGVQHQLRDIPIDFNTIVI